MTHLSAYRLLAVCSVGLVLFFTLVFDHVRTQGIPTAFAEDPVAYKNVEVWVQPEYDEPQLLVMIQGKVTQRLGDKTPVKFLVPTNAEMYSAGSLDASGKYSGGPPARSPSDVPGFDEISFDLTSDTFRVEYYQDSIKGTSEKSLDFEFRTSYAITGLVLSVQQPLKATNFLINPASQATSKADNFTFYEYRYPSVTSDKPLRLAISYTKTDPNPSLSPGTAPLQTGASTDQSRLDLTWPLLGVVVVAIGLIAYSVGKGQGGSGSKRRYDSGSRRQGRSSAKEQQPEGARKGGTKSGGVQLAERPPAQAKGSRSSRSCPSCRQLVDKNAQYCPYCSTEL